MSPAVLLAQAAAQQESAETGAIVVACLAAILICLAFGAHFRAGVGCTGLAALVLIPTSFAYSATVGIRTVVILSVPFAAVWLHGRSSRQAEQNKVRAWQAAARAQRASIPVDASCVGRVQYRGGIAELAPGQEVDVYVRGEGMWLAPTEPSTPVAPLDVSRVAGLRVVDASSSVVLALEGRRGRHQEVELGATPGGLATARQLYAVLDAALPSAAGAVLELLPSFVAPAMACAGCGAGIPAGEERCPYCGRPR